MDERKIRMRRRFDGGCVNETVWIRRVAEALGFEEVFQPMQQE
jgi:hypothetical protein